MRNILIVLLLSCFVFPAGSALAQAPAASGSEPAPMSAADLDKLVGPIALYPDDLIAIILPSATYPLEIVQADRFLDRRKSDKNLPVNDAWQEPIKALLNYPEVIKKMSAELDWTAALGEAVVADQNGVLQAIQRFRRQTQSAGNLKSDDKQVVVVEKEVVKIVPANPEVIYVPQYNPSTVVVSSPYPVYGYAPAPYPVYYYPYAPGAALATGLIWGAAIGAAWSGGRYEANYSGGNNTININRDQSVNRGDVNRTNVDAANTNRTNRQSAQSSTWKSEKKPGQVSGSTARANSPRVGDTSTRSGAGTAGAAGNRQTTPRASTQDSAPRSNAASQGRGGDAFSGYGSGRDAQANSSRGAASRESMASTRSPSVDRTSGSGRAGASAGGGAGRGGSYSGGGGRGFSGGGGGGGRAGRR
ncbi:MULTISPECIES: DUF3300 domain-containing protein [unclassified Caballeronia]|uniref:DUF3300 domain-containing protein n=1 Tax=unclassified Caballeronia TaxID=2646786 RepID=UPI002863E7D9|nr:MULTISPECIES: DUF3300 domain-containing protein [unclassified Caballeronia]MDR5752180.1 DUF3300 domain-containing protein [Caballeronia sp. LZ024]MDR5841891.1 DUF3300 domain-containing protein [Caballeronia sp. LZ031]